MFLQKLFVNGLNTAKSVPFTGGNARNLLLLNITRNLMKTHKGAAKRWRFVAGLNTFKRGKSCRQHGNIGWSRQSLKHLSGRTVADKTHLSHLKKLMPYR